MVAQEAGQSGQVPPGLLGGFPDQHHASDEPEQAARARENPFSAGDEESDRSESSQSSDGRAPFGQRKTVGLNGKEGNEITQIGGHAHEGGRPLPVSRLGWKRARNSRQDAIQPQTMSPPSQKAGSALANRRQIPRNKKQIPD